MQLGGVLQNTRVLAVAVMPFSLSPGFAHIVLITSATMFLHHQAQHSIPHPNPNIPLCKSRSSLDRNRLSQTSSSHATQSSSSQLESLPF